MQGLDGPFGGRAMTYYGRWTYKYEEAARRLGVEPADALAVEDSPAGTAAAVAAGLWVLGVPHGHDEPITSHFRAESLADPAVGDMLRVWGLPL